MKTNLSGRQKDLLVAVNVPAGDNVEVQTALVQVMSHDCVGLPTLRVGSSAVSGVVAVRFPIHHYLQVRAERMGEDVWGIPRPRRRGVKNGSRWETNGNVPVISRSEHVLAATLNDRGLGGDEVVCCQNLEAIAPKRHVTPDGVSVKALLTTLTPEYNSIIFPCFPPVNLLF